MAWKPDGYTSVAPYLVVDGAQRTIDFLTVVFDARPLRMHPMGGRLGHAEVRIDDTVLMLADGMDGWPPVASARSEASSLSSGARVTSVSPAQSRSHSARWAASPASVSG